MKWAIYFFIFHTLLITSLHSQNRDSLIQIYPGIGDTIDLFNRDFFNLYPDIEGFQQASLYVRDNNKLVSKLKLNISNKIVDSSVVNFLAALNTVRKNISKLDEENNLKSRNEPDVIISLKDKRLVKGQLIMFSKDNLYLKSENEDPNTLSTSTDLKIPNLSVSEINIVGQNNTWSSAGMGALVGLLLGGIIGFAGGDDESGLVQFSSEEKALGLGLTFGILGGLIGLITGSGSSTDDYIIHYNSKMDLLKLKDYSKYYFRHEESIDEKFKEFN